MSLYLLLAVEAPRCALLARLVVSVQLGVRELDLAVRVGAAVARVLQDQLLYRAQVLEVCRAARARCVACAGRTAAALAREALRVVERVRRLTGGAKEDVRRETEPLERFLALGEKELASIH